MPTWRKATWTLVLWAVLIPAWLAAARAPAIALTGVIGSGLLGVVWHISRSRFNALIHGPSGRRLGRDLKISLVTPLDGMRTRQLHGAQLVLILGR